METDEPPSYILAIFLSTSPSYWNELIGSIILLVLLLIISGIISASEVAFFSLTKKDLQEDAHNKSLKTKTLSHLLKNSKQLLATILILNNTVNISIVFLATYMVKKYLSIKDYTITIGNQDFTIPLSFLFQVFFITFLILLFGEIIPKIYATRNPLQVSKFSAKMFSIAVKICKPLSMPLMGLSNFIEKRMKKNNKISVNQLSQALQITQEDETTTEEEQKMLEGIINFGNTETKQIMTPRVDVFALDDSTPFPDVLNKVAENGYSRVPVYHEHIDQIVGILYAKDLLPFLEEKNYDWLQLLRPTFFVPENKKIDDLLQNFQTKKIHLAIVVDEYGGTSGIVSLEDVIEEIVGDISDEYDTEEIDYTKLDDDNYLMDGKTSLKDFYRIMDVKETEIFEKNKGEAETIAGFLLGISEEFPKRRQAIQFENYVFLIETINQKRIKRIKITRTPHAEAAD